ncbi:ArsR family transcriptional regulator [Halovivax sp.]|uniref:DUF7344 domain-containing protein n=1 Tax=Halovivax sp. TaxID=1935978 RepID=UPI0025C183D8|nr:ArsR family transcriptional regulator [Halovivax sp.]
MSTREEELVRLLVSERNRAILTRLTDASRPLTVTELAEHLASRERSVVRRTDFERDLQQTRISLHHNLLPKLDEVGVVRYDREENVVSAPDGTPVDPTWFGARQFDELMSRFGTSGETDEATVGVIEGRENVLEYGQRLLDEAAEELFLMYVSEEMLNEECHHHVEDAIDRGVSISIGSQNSRVRDVVRRHFPEVTIWEPQVDWMNDRSSAPKVGRLIFADRDTIMLAIVHEVDDEPPADTTSDSRSLAEANEGARVERAIVGEGEENPLVVLVRELLGPRLDHLDYQSDEFRRELPF